MRRVTLKHLSFVTAGILSLAVLLPQVQAGTRWYHYGSSGSNGSSGGSYSSHGSSGSSGGSSASRGSSGSSGGRVVVRVYKSRGSSGSSGGSYSSRGSSGSSGRSYSSYGSSGSSGSSSSRGSSGSHGSSRGVVVRRVIRQSVASRNAVTRPVRVAGKRAPAVLKKRQAAARNSALLVMNVPADADVYLVNQKMAVKGRERRFRIPTQDTSREYSYPVRVEVIRDGQKVVSESVYRIRSGRKTEVSVAESKESGRPVLVAMR